MRIGIHAKIEMENKILDDLFTKPEQALNERKSEIAKKNRKYYLEPYLKILSQIPTKLIATSNEYKVKIKYNLQDKENSLNESWVYYSDNVEINPVTRSSYYTRVDEEQKLDSRLYEEAAILAQDVISLRKEREAMSSFLANCREKCNTIKQFKEVWPETLHKYLPTPPPKKPRVKKAKVEKPKVEIPIVPDVLHTRLVTNLLEDN